MSKNIITISREFGSGGRYIGKKTADRLGFKFFDKELIEKAASKTEISKEYLEKRGEYAKGNNLFDYVFASKLSDGGIIDDYVLRAQREAIREIAEEGNCVIIGRCADYYLSGREDVLKVFISGNEPQKVNRIRKLEDVSQLKALDMIRDTDRRRALNHEYFTGIKWGIRENYDICLNSSTLGYDNCINIICEAASYTRKH